MITLPIPRRWALLLASAQAPNPSTAPITFEIPTVININKNDGESRGDFHPNEQMPSLPELPLQRWLTEKSPPTWIFRSGISQWV